MTYVGSVKLAKQEWSDDLKSSSSAAFKSLAGKLETSVEILLCCIDVYVLIMCLNLNLDLTEVLLIFSLAFVLFSL